MSRHVAARDRQRTVPPRRLPCRVRRPVLLPRNARSGCRAIRQDRFAVPSGQPDAVTVDLWCPIIQDSPVQRVLAMSLEAPGAYTLTRDPDHGNRMLHAQVPGDHTSGFTIRYTVERRSLRPRLDPARVRTLEAPALFRRELSAEQFVDVNEATRALARDVVGAETNILEQARRIYDHVSDTMTYNAAEQSWKGSTEHALTCSRPLHLALPLRGYSGTTCPRAGI
jgi:hypothetical protein